MKRHLVSPLLLLALFAASAVLAPAKGVWVKDFQKKYPDSKYLKNFHGCMLCHVDVKKGASKLTAFGKDFKAAKGTPAEKFVKIEKLDSDKDKFSNIDEIKAGSNPADPKSTPLAINAMTNSAQTTGTAHMDAHTTGTAAAPKAAHTAKKSGAHKTSKKKSAKAPAAK